MTADALLDRLDGVKPAGTGCWIARCPAHQDRRPSLSVRELADGRILVHDFAGCSTSDVLAAVGLDFGALHPERAIDHHVPRERRPFPATDILRCLAADALFLLVVSNAFLRDERLATSDRARLAIVAKRTQEAVDYVR